MVELWGKSFDHPLFLIVPIGESFLPTEICKFIPLWGARVTSRFDGMSFLRLEVQGLPLVVINIHH